MISYLDENVGKLIDRLEEEGQLDNTVIFFTSDNGPTYTGGTDTPWFDSGGPFRSERGWGKGYCREGGIRVPLIAHWPGHIAAGTTSDHMSSMQDLFPTIHKLADIASHPSDGISMAPTLTGIGEQIEHEYLYWEFPEYGGQRALRWGDYKAYVRDMHQGNTTIEIYDLANDIQEQTDIADQHPDLVEMVQQAFDREHLPSDNPRWQYAVLGEKEAK